MQEMQVSVKLARLERMVLRAKEKSRKAAVKKLRKAQKKLPKRKKKPASERAKRRSRVAKKFVNTKLGRFLLVNAPLEYQLVCEAVEPDKLRSRDAGRVVRVVETIAYASDNPAFHSPEFRVALIDFRLFGRHTRTRIHWSAKQALIAAQNQSQTIKLQDE